VLNGPQYKDLDCVVVPHDWWWDGGCDHLAPKFHWHSDWLAVVDRQDVELAPNWSRVAYCIQIENASIVQRVSFALGLDCGCEANAAKFPWCGYSKNELVDENNVDRPIGLPVKWKELDTVTRNSTVTIQRGLRQ